MSVESKIKIFLSISLLFSSINLLQSQPQWNSWFRASFVTPINEKWLADLEFQHRRQNDFGNDNILDKSLLNSVRGWFFFKKSSNLNFGFSPFAFYSSHKIIQVPQDEFAKVSAEFRVSTFVNFNSSLTSNILLENRVMTEFRWFEGTSKEKIRFRERIGVIYKFSNQSNLSLGNEILLHVVGVKTTNLFDHNRIYGQYYQQIFNKIKAEIGYIYIHLLPNKSQELILENNFYFNLTFEIPTKLNKIKDKQS